jgi:hypothetical protein
MAVPAFEARLEHAEEFPVLGDKAPAAIVDELNRLVEGVKVDVPLGGVLVLEMQVVGFRMPLVVFAGGLDHGKFKFFFRGACSRGRTYSLERDICQAL